MTKNIVGNSKIRFQEEINQNITNYGTNRFILNK